MSAVTDPFDDEAIFEAAAGWWVAQGGDGPYDPEAFRTWLAADARHATAYRQVMATWDSYEAHGTAPEFLDLRGEALDDAKREGRRGARAGIDRRTLAGGAGLAAAAVAAAIGIKAFTGRPRPVATGTGERRTLDLPDRSRLTLDARSALDIAYAGDSRVIHLRNGRAYFEVARDAARPFRVVAGGQTVTALGTAFTVERRDHKISVTLVEGRVAVSGAGAASSPSVDDLRPLEQLVIAEDTGAKTRAMLDLDRAAGWREGKLFFDDVRLADAAARMNDYSDVRISVDGKAAGLRINGMFLAGRTEAFVQALQSYYPVTAEREDGAIILRTRT